MLAATCGHRLLLPLSHALDAGARRDALQVPREVRQRRLVPRSPPEHIARQRGALGRAHGDQACERLTHDLEYLLLAPAQELAGARVGGPTE